MTDAIEIYSQRDPRWAAEHYGMSLAARSSTIGAYGCAITCIAQKLTMLGWPTTPIDVQRSLAAQRGFQARGTFNFVDWWNVPVAYPQFQYNGRHDHPNTPVPARIMELIHDRLSRSEPVIIYVDASPYEDGLQQHFVLATGTLQSGGIGIMNPWNGKMQDLRAYGRTDEIAICGVILLDLKFNARKAA